MDQSDDVLVPLVNGPDQRAVLEHAVTGVSDGTVTVLNVVTPIDAPLSEGRVLEVTEDRHAAARVRARALIADVTEPRDDVEITVAEGRPARTVADRAAEGSVDRIVMGERERSALPSLLFGRSLATVVDDLTDVPTTVVDTAP